MCYLWYSIHLVSETILHRETGWLVSVCKGMSWSRRGTLPTGQTKIAETFSHKTRCPAQDLNWASLEYKSAALPLHQRAW